MFVELISILAQGPTVTSRQMGTGRPERGAITQHVPCAILAHSISAYIACHPFISALQGKETCPYSSDEETEAKRSIVSGSQEEEA